MKVKRIKGYIGKKNWGGRLSLSSAVYQLQDPGQIVNLARFLIPSSIHCKKITVAASWLNCEKYMS